MRIKCMYLYRTTYVLDEKVYNNIDPITKLGLDLGKCFCYESKSKYMSCQCVNAGIDRAG